MKNLLLIVLVVTLLLTAGCTDETQNSVVTPTPNPVVTPTHTPAGTRTPSPVDTQTTQVAGETVTVLVTPESLPQETGSSDQGSWQTYTSKDFSFAIQIPESWTASGNYVTAAGVKKYKVIFDDPSFTSSQYITITPDSAGLSLEDWANIFVTQVKADSSKKLVSQSPLQLDGTPAKKIILTLGYGRDTLESTIILGVKGQNSYFMEFTSRKQDYPGYSQDVDRMIRSFTFT
jgi:hypothetical protein